MTLVRMTFEYSNEGFEHKLFSKNFKRHASMTRVTPARFSRKALICLWKTDSKSLENPGHCEAAMISKRDQSMRVASATCNAICKIYICKSEWSFIWICYVLPGWGWQSQDGPAETLPECWAYRRQTPRRSPGQSSSRRRWPAPHSPTRHHPAMSAGFSHTRMGGTQEVLQVPLKLSTSSRHCTSDEGAL